MAWGVTYPAVKAALVALWDAALTVDVVPGPVIGPASAGVTVLVVGYADALAPDVAAGTLATEGYGQEPEREQYSIQCLISANIGSTDIAAVETQAFQIFASVGAALATNHTLSGLTLVTALDTWRLSEFQDQATGATARLAFTVAVDAYTTP